MFTDPLIIPLILIFLSCCGKAQDNIELRRENSKPRCESQINDPLSRTLFLQIPVYLGSLTFVTSIEL